MILAQWDSGRRMHLNLGVSLPTGSIDEKHTNGNTWLWDATWLRNL